MSNPTARPDLRRLIRRSFLAALAVQGIYALQLYLFFTHPGAAFNRMLVLVECLLFCTLTCLLFQTVLQPIRSLIGEGFIRAGLAVSFLLILVIHVFIRKHPPLDISPSLLLDMSALEIVILFLLILIFRAWTVLRKHTD